MLHARGTFRSRTGDSDRFYWARSELIVATTDVTDVDLVWMPSTSIETVLAFTGPESVPRPKAPPIYLLDSNQAFVRDIPTAAVGQSGRPVIPGIAPGDYWLKSDVPPPWVLQSVRDETGNDFSNRPIPIGSNSGQRTIYATYGAATARLEGRMFDPLDRATSEKAIVLFPDSLDALNVPWATVRAVRPDTTGRFLIPDLVEGNYLLAAFDDDQAGDWRRSEFLSQIVLVAVRVTVPRSGVVIRDLRLAPR